MQEPVWLPLRALIDAHAESIRLQGGAPGISNPALLESAAERARTKFHYASDEQTLPKLAAAYCFGLCRNHPFVDGNKRIAFLAAFMFLDINGYYLDAPELEAYAIIMAVASGTADEAELEAWMARWAQPL